MRRLGFDSDTVYTGRTMSGTNYCAIRRRTTARRTDYADTWMGIEA